MEFPAKHNSRTNEMNSKDTTVFVGLVIRGRLDEKILQKKAQKLVSLWPVLGGHLITTVSDKIILPRAKAVNDLS